MKVKVQCHVITGYADPDDIEINTKISFKALVKSEIWTTPFCTAANYCYNFSVYGPISSEFAFSLDDPNKKVFINLFIRFSFQ